ncbi:rRNA maturation RNase YbeY [Peribacillus castrilensis]|jgi:probable rRNA maturation factor|uniref:Endoribonuclease YbeY n=2 Tax=Peribacillus TaxID=2675229 RepID=A0AAJ1QPZ4_9BACI|nr:MULTISPECIES: rRNA maturation RNase YbeY [Bacillaceae]KOR79711.1 rRNA maturation factor [Bacillus sp. FJAT-21352]KOR86611.1 rRNA maturation factor [Bacillus sp. FJAT-22058]KRF49755.1 rRNA maturation factor [Bacillus sp. Soil745]MBD8135021.1 rRNA maturation RNase YbeY [Bacillus sp. CFBP 13597]MCD1161234.1 rRNA maturation RNase YbeY [Peribacillus castrilensis]MCP1092619.1 rRNA maturation RNase YbeY [Bacillaceae bacterium OS4b]MDP9740079.1 putative rRNA maturation factor [Bacillus sp. B2I3]
MILAIDLMDETNEVTEEAQQLVESILQFAARKENIEKDTELSVTFVDNDRIREINKEYRHKDSATDVISFALEEMGEDEVEIVGAEMPRMLGDIIISIERTKEQAEEYGHSFDRELGFLALHGFLHLLGFDHMNEEDEKVMFTKQKEILEEYGLSREG